MRKRQGPIDELRQYLDEEWGRTPKLAKRIPIRTAEGMIDYDGFEVPGTGLALTSAAPSLFDATWSVTHLRTGARLGEVTLDREGAGRLLLVLARYTNTDWKAEQPNLGISIPELKKLVVAAQTGLANEAGTKLWHTIQSTQTQPSNEDRHQETAETRASRSRAPKNPKPPGKETAETQASRSRAPKNPRPPAQSQPLTRRDIDRTLTARENVRATRAQQSPPVNIREYVEAPRASGCRAHVLRVSLPLPWHSSRHEDHLYSGDPTTQQHYAVRVIGSGSQWWVQRSEGDGTQTVVGRYPSRAHARGMAANDYLRRLFTTPNDRTTLVQDQRVSIELAEVRGFTDKFACHVPQGRFLVLALPNGWHFALHMAGDAMPRVHGGPYHSRLAASQAAMETLFRKMLTESHRPDLLPIIWLPPKTEQATDAA